MHQMFHARDATLSDAAARNDELTSRLGHDIAALRSAIGDGRSEAEAARVDVVQLVGGTRARLEAEAEAHAARGNEQLAAALAEVRREVAVAVESVRADGGALRTALETRWVRRALHRQAAQAVLANALDAMPCHTVRAMCGWASFASRPNTTRLARCYRAPLLLARHIVAAMCTLVGPTASSGPIGPSRDTLFARSRRCHADGRWWRCGWLARFADVRWSWT
jgi:hypothetical protein